MDPGSVARNLRSVTVPLHSTGSESCLRPPMTQSLGWLKNNFVRRLQAHESRTVPVFRVI